MNHHDSSDYSSALRRAACCVGAGTVLLISGCATTTGDDSASVSPQTSTPTSTDEPEAPPVTTPVETPTTTTPVLPEPIALPPIDRSALATVGVEFPQTIIDLDYDLRSVLLTDCMAIEGYDFDRGPQPVELDPIGQGELHPLDREYAQLYGYGLAPRPPSPMNDKANSDVAFADALFERGTGCMDRVAALVDARTGVDTLANDVTLMRQEPLMVMSSWFDSPDRAELVGSWSQCMSGGGYNISDPLDANNVAETLGQSAGIELRLVDIDCDIAVGLTDARSRHDLEAANDWASGNADEIEDLNMQIIETESLLERFDPSTVSWD